MVKGWGFIKNKFDLLEVTKMNYYSNKNRLELIFTDESYFYVSTKPEWVNDLVDDIKKANSKIIYVEETVAEENNEQISTWYEFQISNGTKRNNRIDGLIINHTKREVYLIEAKRFSKNNLPKKQKELGNDYTRIENLGLGRFEELFYEKESISTYKVFGVLLFDLWTETPAQEGLLKNWNNICDNPSSDLLSDFFYFNNSDSKIDCAKSCLLPIVREVICNRWKDENYSYFLGALIWGKSNKE